jgi:hypothetical protein
MQTPSQHRQRLGQSNTSQVHSTMGSKFTSVNATAARGRQRQPLSNIGVNTLKAPHFREQGISVDANIAGRENLFLPQSGNKSLSPFLYTSLRGGSYV